MERVEGRNEDDNEKVEEGRVMMRVKVMLMLHSLPSLYPAALSPSWSQRPRLSPPSSLVTHHRLQAVVTNDWQRKHLVVRVQGPSKGAPWSLKRTRGTAGGSPQMISPLCPQLTSLYANDSVKLSDVLIWNSLANQWGALWLPWCRSAGAPWYQGESEWRQVDSRAVWFLSCHLRSVITSWGPLPRVMTPR